MSPSYGSVETSTIGRLSGLRADSRSAFEQHIWITLNRALVANAQRVPTFAKYSRDGDRPPSVDEGVFNEHIENVLDRG